MRKNSKQKKNSRGQKNILRRITFWLSLTVIASYIILAAVGDWFVHHSREWMDECRTKWYGFIVNPLIYFGEFPAEITDAFGLTGEDCIYSFDEEPPAGNVLFKGAPVRTGAPCPDDIRILDRGEFIVGWSPSLRHPVWVAYHVPPKALYNIEKRPSFQKDKNAPSAPAAGDYAKTGYDRGHMAPNHAIASRFGEAQQKLTFLTSNICPQTPALNQGPWCDFELRIADLWAGCYGEIWCITGAISQNKNAISRETLSGTNIDVPEFFYQIIAAQSPMDKSGNSQLRTLAILMPNVIDRRAYPARYIVSIDEIEKLSGLNFFPDLPSFIEKPMEAQRATRMWPCGLAGAWRLFAGRFLK